MDFGIKLLVSFRLALALPKFQKGFVVVVRRYTLYKMKHEYVTHHSMKTRPRTWRPLSTTQKMDDAIVDAHDRNPFKYVSSTAADVKVSKYTVIRRLSDVKLQARRPVIKLKLTDQHKAIRFQCAREHIRWNLAQWNDVLFTDEVYFQVDRKHRSIFCYGKKDQRCGPI